MPAFVWNRTPAYITVGASEPYSGWRLVSNGSGMVLEGQDILNTELFR